MIASVIWIPIIAVLLFLGVLSAIVWWAVGPDEDDRE